MEQFRDKTMYRRLSSQLLAALQQDVSHVRGERTVENGNLQGLKGFEFNKQTRFHRVCRASHQVQLNREKGTVDVTFDKFDPRYELTVPKHTTHFKMMLTVHAINFDTHQTDSYSTLTSTIPLHTQLQDGLALHLDFKPNDPRHLIVSLGIIFVEILDGREYEIKAGIHNAMCITRVYEKQALVTQPAKPSAATILAHKPVALIPPTTLKRQHQNSTRKLHRSIIGTKQVSTAQKMELIE
ncbi:hypothetical protein [Chitinophaga skermanii]|nr:hypothetical protein [Chitinophaga skermanii]